METEPLLFSQAKVSERCRRRYREGVLEALNQGGGPRDMVIGTRPRSIDFSYFVPHWPSVVHNKVPVVGVGDIDIEGCSRPAGTARLPI